MRAFLIGAAMLLGACATPVNVNLHETNAWSTQDSVIISSSMSQLIDTRGELAFIMAHELGHIILLHHGTPPTFQHEVDADAFAFRAMEIAGHDLCQGISAMIKVDRAVMTVDFHKRMVYWRSLYPTCKEYIP
jgi:hypothetical protein